MAAVRSCDPKYRRLPTLEYLIDLYSKQGFFTEVQVNTLRALSGPIKTEIDRAAKYVAHHGTLRPSSYDILRRMCSFIGLSCSFIPDFPLPPRQVALLEELWHMVGFFADGPEWPEIVAKRRPEDPYSPNGPLS
jgi:hypothetical protein